MKNINHSKLVKQYNNVVKQYNDCLKSYIALWRTYYTSTDSIPYYQYVAEKQAKMDNIKISLRVLAKECKKLKIAIVHANQIY